MTLELIFKFRTYTELIKIDKFCFRSLGKTWNAKDKPVNSGNKNVAKGRQMPSNSTPMKNTQSSVKVTKVAYRSVSLRL